ncbi:unnamed protein product, partial [Ectocarpus fasciculatus]
MSDSAATVITDLVCPLLGTAICCAMYLSPLQAVLAARRSGSLGTLNPVPFGIAVLNALGWAMYAVLLRDYFIFVANAPGVVFGMFFVISSLSLLSKTDGGMHSPVYRVLELILVVGLSCYALLIMIIGITVAGQGVAKTVVAFVANGLCIIYYSAPCSTMLTVVRTRDPSSLHLPMILANALNAVMWCVYGFFALNDLFVYVPNGIGLFLATLQLSLIAIYRNS